MTPGSITAATLPSRCREPGCAPAGETLAHTGGPVAVGKEPVDGGACSRHVRAERAVLDELLRKRRRGEVVRWQRGQIAGFQCRAKLGAPLLEAMLTGEHRIDVGRRRLRRAMREQEEHRVVLWQVERLELGAVPGAELRAAGEEERDVYAQPCGDLVEALLLERRPQGFVRKPKRGRRVGAASAKPCRDGDPLLDLHRPVRLYAGRSRQALERIADERVVREAGDLERRARPERDPVREVDGLEHGRDLVLSIRPRRPDDERQVDLRRRLARPHRSAAVSATNSSGSRASARRLGSRLIAASASAARARGASPASSSELGSVLRRCAKAASTTDLIATNSFGSGFRRNATSAESTLGGGRKTVRETGWKPVRSVASWTSTETAPYAFVLGRAKSRSATSRWTITVQWPTLGRPSRLSTISGVATL